MSKSLLSRAIVLQSLFEWDLDVETGTVDALRPEVILERNIKEFDPDSKDRSFMHRILNGVLENRQEIEEAIATAAPEWPIETISRVDRNILRIGVLELLFASVTAVPERVSFEMASELTQRFCNESSTKFVNKVLVTIYIELVCARLQCKI